MSFALNTHSLPTVDTYDRAYQLWQGIAPLRGYPEDAPRPIGRREGRNPSTVRAVDWEGDRPVLTFRYHQLDIATWYPDGTCVMQTYPSRSTTAFLNSVCPKGMCFHGSECGHVSMTMTVRSETGCVGMETRYYRIDDQRPLTVANDPEDKWCVHPHPDADQPAGTTSVEHWRVDRKEAGKWYKHYGLDEFRAFFGSFTTMTDMSAMGNEERRNKLRLGWERGVLDVLEDDPEARRRWMPEAAKTAACLAGLPSWGNHDTGRLTKDVMDTLRDVIRRKHQTFNVETVNWTDDLGRLKRAEDSVRKSYKMRL